MATTGGALTLRFAGPDDAALLARHRAAVWHETAHWDVAVLAAHEPVWADFMRQHIGLGNYVAFFAERGRDVVGSGALLINFALPGPGRTAGRAGRVHSVYVLPDARRAGIARAIVERIIAYARDIGLHSLMLHPTQAARPLYTSLGFIDADEMSLRL